MCVECWPNARGMSVAFPRLKVSARTVVRGTLKISRVGSNGVKKVSLGIETFRGSGLGQGKKLGQAGKDQLKPDLSGIAWLCPCSKGLGIVFPVQLYSESWFCASP